ncbi:MAG: ASKHA domain-containing protein [Candidatus Bathyarchaeota archaeon]|nr:ASKHA domain-containing protein [Candidatus Bathyarchaeota archaeon]
MANIIVSPDNKIAKLKEGKTLLSYLQELETNIHARCGGRGTCKGCIVKVSANKNLSSLTEIEKKAIQRKGFRLACQAKITKEDEDIFIEIPLYTKFKILERGKVKRIPLNPFIKKMPTSLGERIFWEKREIGAYDGEIYGLALDIGTTTLSMVWIDLEKGNELFVSSMLNPQFRYGDNIIDRINYAKIGRQKHLERAIREGVNEMIKEVPLDSEKIYELVIVGNTAMRDIFVGNSVEKLGESPFEPITLKPVNKIANELNLVLNPKANVYAFPLIGHFVGADALGAILATEIHTKTEISMMIDIGTNTEIALGNKDGIVVTSCASGPAFEGSGIKCGIGAVEGAIQMIDITENLEINYNTINNAPPIGICGSGLIDILANMLERKIIDWTGKFIKDNKKFVISEKNKIFLDGEDIDNLKLAKAAISVGAKFVSRDLNIEIDDIKKLYLAGAFGTYINRENALKIGLLPNIPLERIEKVGNAAMEGARQALISKEKRREAEEIPKKIRHIRLEMEKDFHDRFVEELCFEKYRP